MKDISLVVLAAGMGSRFGGLKQVEPVDAQGRFIIDFSIYDALVSGFSRVVFVIKRENLEVFRDTVGSRFENKTEVCYAFQELTDIPAGFCVPEGRTRPWGTGHAVYAARDYIKGDFVVINSDDFYGRGGISTAAEFLKSDRDGHAMVAYDLSNTLTENGTVNRGICAGGTDGLLTHVEEKLALKKVPGGAECPAGDRTEFYPDDTPVSMNLFAFRHSMLDDISQDLNTFFANEVSGNPVKKEFFLPAVVNRTVETGRGIVHLLRTDEKWYGVTYREDLDSVKRAIKDMIDRGIYPAES